MRKSLFITGTAAFVFLIFGLAADASAQTVSGSIGNGTVTKGRTARAVVVLDIPAGLHTNSNRPGSEYAIATTVRPSARGVTLGRVSYPPGRNKRFEFSDRPLNVYVGRVRFPFNVTVPANYRGSTITVNVAVRFQACTDEVCYAPRTQNITLTANVR
jgi:DsbC/DsbD-like thiol-disulfide interchange protein